MMFKRNLEEPYVFYEKLFQLAYDVYSNSLYNPLHIHSVIFMEDRNQIGKTASLSSVRQSIAGKQCFYQHAPPNIRSRVGCPTSEKNPLWALLTDAFQ